MTYRLAIAALVVSVELMRAYYFRKSSGPGLGSAYQRNRQDVYLIGGFSIAWFASLITYVVIPRWLSWASVELDPGIRWVGVALGLTAMAGLAWVHRSLGSNFSSVLRIKEDHQLVQSGPYRWVRHPMYTVFFLLAGAYFLISANLLVGLAGLGLTVALVLLRVPREERDLAEKFGERYQVYRTQTGRLLPRFGRTPGA